MDPRSIPRLDRYSTSMQILGGRSAFFEIFVGVGAGSTQGCISVAESVTERKRTIGARDPFASLKMIFLAQGSSPAKMVLRALTVQL